MCFTCVHGGRGVSVQGWSLSRGSLFRGGLCPRDLCASPGKGSLSRRLPVWLRAGSMHPTGMHFCLNDWFKAGIFFFPKILVISYAQGEKDDSFPRSSNVNSLRVRESEHENFFHLCFLSSFWVHISFEKQITPSQ